jgi:hypothetical protein
MKHISLDEQPDGIQQFVLSLPIDIDGSVLELNGSPVLRVSRVADDEPLDEEKLKTAILARRDASRASNAEWEDVDREMWHRLENDNS